MTPSLHGGLPSNSKGVPVARTGVVTAAAAFAVQRVESASGDPSCNSKGQLFRCPPGNAGTTGA